jgi:type II secretory pathway pseudopilin PulG
MAATNKPTAVHYSLIVFVIISIVLGVTTYMFQSEYSKARKDEEKAKADLNTANTSIRTLDDEIVAAKKLLGKGQDKLGNPDDATTALGDFARDLNEQGQTDKESTAAGTLAKMRQTIDTMKATLDSETKSKLATEQELLGLQTRYRNDSDRFQQAKTAAEADLQKLVNERDEKLNAKDQEIATLRGQYNQAQVELEQEKEARSKERKQLQDENLRLTLINDKLREELDEIKKESFEVGDGFITRVENAANLVWINLGDSDFLKPRMTFSVYSKDTPGVGRTSADIKGKIEVTRILDAHSAEAKMIDQDNFRPMAPGDIVYTPLWSPGRTEKFAVVGKLDLDNDGQSDRELFHQEMAVRGAELSDEVDDDGERTGTGINETTKFLVLGSIPDIANIANDDDRAKATKISGHLKDMRQEARLHGIRIVPLSDFLNYIGYKPKRRLFRPGFDTKYNLKSGAASVGVNQPLGDISSSGQVSGSFNKSKTSQPQTSSGQTSKLFGGR